MPEDLLTHVLTNTCTDNDCEVHNIDVALNEEVVSRHDLAFWLAGYLAGLRYDHDPNEAFQDFVDDLHIEGAYSK